MVYTIRSEVTIQPGFGLEVLLLDSVMYMCILRPGCSSVAAQNCRQPLYNVDVFNLPLHSLVMALAFVP
jgi:hypothetical protein